jgi:hypothetical protein
MPAARKPRAPNATNHIAHSASSSNCVSTTLGEITIKRDRPIKSASVQKTPRTGVVLIITTYRRWPCTVASTRFPRRPRPATSRRPVCRNPDVSPAGLLLPITVLPESAVTSPRHPFAFYPSILGAIPIVVTRPPNQRRLRDRRQRQRFSFRDRHWGKGRTLIGYHAATQKESANPGKNGQPIDSNLLCADCPLFGATCTRTRTCPQHRRATRRPTRLPAPQTASPGQTTMRTQRQPGSMSVRKHRCDAAAGVGPPRGAGLTVQEPAHEVPPPAKITIVCCRRASGIWRGAATGHRFRPERVACVSGSRTYAACCPLCLVGPWSAARFQTPRDPGY